MNTSIRSITRKQTARDNTKHTQYLESKRRERPVVRAAAPDSARKEFGASKQVCAHECAVGVAADADAVAVTDAPLGAPFIHPGVISKRLLTESQPIMMPK